MLELHLIIAICLAFCPNFTDKILLIRGLKLIHVSAYDLNCTIYNSLLKKFKKMYINRSNTEMIVKKRLKRLDKIYGIKWKQAGELIKLLEFFITITARFNNIEAKFQQAYVRLCWIRRHYLYKNS